MNTCSEEVDPVIVVDYVNYVFFTFLLFIEEEAPTSRKSEL